MAAQAPDPLGRLFTLVEDVGAIRSQQDDIYHRLFGNGQVGILKEHDLRIDALETLVKEGKGAKWMLITIGSCMGAAWGFLVGVSELIPKILHFFGLR